MNDRQRELARIRQARRRARLKEEGTSVTVTLTKQEEAMLQELCRVRRPGRTPYSMNEFSSCCLSATGSSGRSRRHSWENARLAES